MERHLTAEELARYHDGLATSDAAPIERHLQSCAACTEVLAIIRSVDVALQDEETWHFTDELQTARHQRQLDALAQRIANEDKEAEAMLAEYLANPLQFIWSGVATKRRYRTGGVVRVLARASAEVREGNPLHALNLADAAIAHAEALPIDHYPGRGIYHLRGLAWKERANACRYLNRYEDAFNACDNAERAYRRLLVHDLEVAVIRYVRTTILWKRQRLVEALRFARECVAAFAALGDRQRWIAARLLEGSILVDSHAAEEGRDIFLDLAQDGDVTRDVTMRARIENNLANAYLELADVASATRHFSVALQLFESLEMATEATRARWKIGVAALISGNVTEAVRGLRIAKQECEAHQMLGDAALVALDLAEALLVLESRDEAHRLAMDVFEYAKSSGMVPAALTAAAFLRETAKAGKLTSTAVRHVRDFLRRLEAQPTLSFEPPPHR